eukprot:9029047-Pyramimonas_sp.AAC.1
MHAERATFRRYPGSDDGRQRDAHSVRPRSRSGVEDGPSALGATCDTAERAFSSGLQGSSSHLK